MMLPVMETTYQKIVTALNQGKTVRFPSGTRIVLAHNSDSLLHLEWDSLRGTMRSGIGGVNLEDAVIC